MRADKQDEQYEKIFFRLEKDEDGYPPDNWETLWAFEIEDGLYTLDSIPFFVRGVSWKDVVSVEREGNELHFTKIVRPSDHSVLRVIVFDESEIEKTRQNLQQIGCDTEQSHIPGLLSIDCPPSVEVNRVLEFLASGEQDGRWEYEEASIRYTRS